MSDGLVLTQDGVTAVQQSLRERELDGWLLYEFRQSNPISASLLSLPWTTRRGFALIPAEGEPIALIHAIERVQWQHWPWRTLSYSGWRELEQQLGALLSGRGRIAMEVSARSAVPTLDRVPMGIVELVKDTGVEIVSSGDLVSLFYARWSDAQREQHYEAARILPKVAKEAFEMAAGAIEAGKPMREGAVAAWIRRRCEELGVGTEQNCIVAIGPRASDPHYDPGEEGELIERGQVLLIDLWGKREPNAVPADQTWMGFMGSEVPDDVQKVWQTVRDARNAAVEFLEKRHQAGESVRGFEADDIARDVIRSAGYGDYFVHRTGHSIDRDLHGSGPNLDNLESRDDRELLPGVGFSVEPGIYIPDVLGIRSEVDVFWGPGGPEVTTEHPQDEMFLLL